MRRYLVVIALFFAVLFLTPSTAGAAIGADVESPVKVGGNARGRAWVWGGTTTIDVDRRTCPAGVCYWSDGADLATVHDDWSYAYRILTSGSHDYRTQVNGCSCTAQRRISY